MSSAPASPALRERYDRRRRAIVDDAAREFARRGFAETSVPALAEALGIAAGGIYHYFAGKDDLLVAICDQVMDPLLEQARALAGDGRPAGAELAELVRLWVAQVIARRDHMLVFQQQRHVIDGSPQWRGVREARKEFERIVDELLGRVQEAGGLRGDRRLVLSALLGMVNHTAQWYRPRGPLSPDEIADGYLRLVVPG